MIGGSIRGGLAAILLAQSTVALASSVQRGDEVRGRLDYRRTAGAAKCPSEQAFTERVAATLGRDPFAVPSESTSPGTANVVVLLAFDEREGNLRATIAIHATSGESLGSQVLESPSTDCREIFEAEDIEPVKVEDEEE